MTLMEAIERFKERCESNPKFQELKEKIEAARMAELKVEMKNEAEENAAE